DQRKGRCGRVAEGLCIRLYAEEDYLKRREFTLPEIQRANLAEVILRMMALNLGDVEKFPFIDPPDLKQVRDGYRVLEELGAIRPIPPGRKTKDAPPYQLSPMGRTMARIPLDPRLSRILLQAQQEACLSEALIIAAALSIQDPRQRPPEESAKADQAQRQFQDPTSDFVTYLNIWRHFQLAQQGQGERLSRGQRQKRARHFCRAHYLSFRRMGEWHEIHRQIKTIIRECGLARADGPVSPAVPPAPTSKSPQEFFGPAYQALHHSILSGFLSNIAFRTEKNQYQGVGGKQLMLFPGSGLFNRGGKWIVMAEQVTTSRLFARTAATVEPAWIESMGQPFLKSAYQHPRWDPQREQVLADQQISLWSLVLVPKRTVALGPVNPEEASAIFIREALVEGNIRGRRPFLQHNQALLETFREQEERLRRRDIVVEDEILADFYQQRIEGVYDPRTLDRRIKKQGSDQFLRMTPEDLARYRPDPAELAQYPDAVTLGRQAFGVSYRFEPGASADGVTVAIPQSLAATIPAEELEWGVPGLLAEKISALIKGLPKAYRKPLVPVPQTVEFLMAELSKHTPAGKSLRQILGEIIHTKRGLNIPGSAWPREALPDHLQTRIAIVDPKGKELAASRDPAILHCSPAPETVDPHALQQAARPHEHQGLSRWDFGDLPPTIPVSLPGQGTWPLIPTLVPPENPSDLKQGVNLKLLADPREAQRMHAQGVAALYQIQFAKELKFLKRNLKIPRDLISAANYLGGAARQLTELYQRVVRDLFVRDFRTQREFETHLETVGPEILPRGQRLLAAALPVIAVHAEAREALSHLARGHRGRVYQEAMIKSRSEELVRLVPAHMLQLYDEARLAHVVRYIQALMLRAQRGVLDLAKERRRGAEVARFEKALQGMLGGLDGRTSKEKSAAIEEFHWLLEEYKVSLFAQELKTAQPVSTKRLEEKLAAITRML
ncbi:MAG: ATP-dependent RNA helicase HrpA, partial [Desulfobacterales bacterium]